MQRTAVTKRLKHEKTLVHSSVWEWVCVSVCVSVVMNPWPSVCPLNPRWPWKQEFQLTHHRSVFFSSGFVFVSLFAQNVGRAWTRPDSHQPSPSSVFLSSFFPSFLSLLCLGFSFLPPFLLNWVVWQAGLSDSTVYVGSLRGRGGTRHCAPRDGLVFHCYCCMSEHGPD